MLVPRLRGKVVCFTLPRLNVRAIKKNFGFLYLIKIHHHVDSVNSDTSFLCIQDYLDTLSFADIQRMPPVEVCKEEQIRPSYLFTELRSAENWLKHKHLDDNLQGLWRIHDGLYDLSGYIDKHPGGRQWLEITKVRGGLDSIKRVLL